MTSPDVNAEATCKKCGEPLSRNLITLEADWHMLCFPDDEWKKWLEKHYAEDK